MKKNVEKNIFIFGDSNVQGFWDSKGGWPTRLKQHFDKLMVDSPAFPEHGFYYMVFPLGVTDDTTRHILERFEFETEKRRVWQQTEEIFVFAAGKNDTALLDMNESKRNIYEIIKRAKRFSNNIVFLEVLAVDEKLTQPVPWNDKLYYANSKIEEFNELLNKIAEDNGAKVIQLYDEWVDMDYKKLLADGTHFNDDGHKFVFEKVKGFLLENYF